MPPACKGVHCDQKLQCEMLRGGGRGAPKEQGAGSLNFLAWSLRPSVRGVPSERGSQHGGWPLVFSCSFMFAGGQISFLQPLITQPHNRPSQSGYFKWLMLSKKATAELLLIFRASWQGACIVLLLWSSNSSFRAESPRIIHSPNGSWGQCYRPWNATSACLEERC